jgi:hypothetical protein
MRKNLFFSLIAGTLVLLSSCSKDVESTSLKIDQAHKSPVKIYVYAQMDLTKYGYEYAPAGTQVVLSVNYSDLNPTVGSGKWVDTVKVNENGYISTMLPVDDNGVTLNVEPITFEYDQIRPYGSNTEKVKKIYSSGKSTFSISTSSNIIEEVFYGTTSLVTQADYSEVTFTVYADLNASLVGNELVVNKSIVFYCNNGWSVTKTTDANGKVVVSVPVDEYIYFEFQADKIEIAGPPVESALYNYDSGAGYYYDKTEKDDIYGGSGDLIP